MAIRLITGRLQQRSRYCAKQQQFFTENSMRYCNPGNFQTRIYFGHDRKRLFGRDLFSDTRHVTVVAFFRTSSSVAWAKQQSGIVAQSG